MLAPHIVGASPVHSLSSPQSRCASSRTRSSATSAMNASGLESVGCVFCEAMPEPAIVLARCVPDRAKATRSAAVRQHWPMDTLREGHKVWVEQADGSQRAAIFVGEA